MYSSMYNYTCTAVDTVATLCYSCSEFAPVLIMYCLYYLHHWVFPHGFSQFSSPFITVLVRCVSLSPFDIPWLLLLAVLLLLTFL